mmetsp:Transcript_526/g.597  ORF Transcript_526/g.597 Transcript_526/m.597 type:complete len:183 (+) Transcript_526:26-574(+)
MGNPGSKYSKEKRRIIIIGLDDSGKSTLYDHLQNIQPDQSKKKAKHNLDLNDLKVVTLKMKKLKLMFEKLASDGHKKALWRHHYTGCQGVIFLVDAVDKSKFESVKAELNEILADQQLKYTAFAILANKADLANALTSKELKQELGLEAYADRAVEVFDTNCVNGDGVDLVLEFLTEKMVEF